MSKCEFSTRSNRPIFKYHNFPVTFTNYTHCYAKVVVATSGTQLSRFEAGISAGSANIAADMERKKKVQTFIIGNIDDRSRCGIADKKFIYKKKVQGFYLFDFTSTLYFPP